MKRFLLIIGLLSFVFSKAQEKVYHPEADAKKDIDSIILLAENQPKNIIIQVGGNWCKWCLLFNDFINTNEEVKKLKDQFYYYHLNHSRENENKELLEKYNHPERYGFPVLLVLDPKGNLLHTQETASLEEGKGYNQEKVMAFFTKWLYKNEVEDVVQQQVDAYNEGDLDKFLSFYSEDVEISNLHSQQTTKGKGCMKNNYESLFDTHPALHCTIKNRIVLGNKVIDHELVKMDDNEDNNFEAVAIYEIENGLIQKVTFVRP